MLSERGIPTLPDMDAYRAVFGFPIKSYYEKMGYRFGPQDEPYEHVADEFIIWYDKLYRTALLRPGIVPFLDRLKGEGYRQVLLSATRYDQLVEQVAAFGSVGDRFERKLGLTDHYAFSKAALARDFIEREGIPRERCSSATRTTTTRCPPPSAAPACSWRAATRAEPGSKPWASPSSRTSPPSGTTWTGCERTGPYR